MSLLRFSVGNYRSIKEVVTLDLAPKLGSRTTLPVPATDVAQPVTAIFGANAAGKTNVLDALSFAHQAIMRSATSWRDGKMAPHVPFALDPKSRKEPSFFEFDFTVDETRYLYGFTYGNAGVEEEWLSYVPKRRWAKCFIRNTSKEAQFQFDWNDSLFSKSSQRALAKINKRSLILSEALRREEEFPTLEKVGKSLTSSFNFLTHSESAQRDRIQKLIASIQQGNLELNEISSLMQAADTGIKKVSLDETQIPSHLLEKIKKVGEILNGKVLDTDEIKTVVYSLVFHHEGTSGDYPLRIVDESSGTFAWLSIIPTLLDTLRNGKVLIADELDSSLHPSLVEMIINSFTDLSINQKGAQLVLTTHNTNVLDHMDELSLAASSIWFAEKTSTGESSFFSLADFPNRKDANYERRYLSGRYGAMPKLSPATLRDLRDAVDVAAHVVDEVPPRAR